MRTSGVFTTHSFYHKIKKLDPFNIYYFSDVHKYARLHNAERWNRFLDIARADKTALYVGGGDYTEIGSTKERKALAVLNRESHEDMPRTIDNMLMDQCLGFCKDIDFMRGRIIGLIGGNHDAQFQSGIFMSQKIADILGAKWLGVCSLGRITIDFYNKTQSITEYLHHGKGGGSPGNALNKAIDMHDTVESDICFMSDSHTRTLDMTAKMRLGGTNENGEIRMIMRDIISGRTGSFLNGYVNGEGSYVTDMALKPASLGGVKVQVVPKQGNKKINGKRNQVFSIDLIPGFV